MDKRQLLALAAFAGYPVFDAFRGVSLVWDDILAFLTRLKSQWVLVLTCQ